MINKGKEKKRETKEEKDDKTRKIIYTEIFEQLHCMLLRFLHMYVYRNLRFFPVLYICIIMY